MPDLIDLFTRWWKQILSLVVFSIIITIAIVLLMPVKYLGTATALPAPPYAMDKTGVFSQNLQNLYAVLGTSDDLDKFLGTAQLDTPYLAVAAQNNLATHYGYSNDEEGLQKAAIKFKDNARVIKTDYGELQVKVWDVDKSVAALLSNALIEQLQAIHQKAQLMGSEGLLSTIKEQTTNARLSLLKLSDSFVQQTDHSATVLLDARRAGLLQEIQEYEKLEGEYALMLNVHPPTLIIIERAKPALRGDKPRSLEAVGIAGAVSLLFGFLIAIVLEKRH